MILPSLQYAGRVLRTADKRHLAKFMWNFGVKGIHSVNLYKKRMKEGIYFPPFLYISILNSCNLRCQGCWVDVDKPQVKLDLSDLNKIVTEAKAHGNSFFGILGGEPFMHTELLLFPSRALNSLPMGGAAAKTSSTEPCAGSTTVLKTSSSPALPRASVRPTSTTSSPRPGCAN